MKEITNLVFNFFSFGIFRLTDPPGLDVISNCKKTPAFHPHPDLPIYTVRVLDNIQCVCLKTNLFFFIYVLMKGADEGGHVSVSDYDFIVLDVRDKK